MKDFINAYRNIFNFSGETSVKEFWSFVAINLIVGIIFRLICKKLSLSEYVYNIYQFISFFVFIAAGFRRLKNAGYSGWLFLVPIVNLILALFPAKELKGK